MIQVDDISIIELSFSQEYTRAVEEKQIAQQQAERAKYLVMQAAQDKKSTIIKAQGEARAAELLGPAIGKSGAYVQIKRIEAARDIADSLAKSRNRAYLDSDTLLLNLTGSLDANLEKMPSGSMNQALETKIYDTAQETKKQAWLIDILALYSVDNYLN